MNPLRSLRTTLTVMLPTRLSGWNTKGIVVDPHNRMGATPLSAGLAACSKPRPRVQGFPSTAIHLRRECQSVIDIHDPSLAPISKRQSAGIRWRQSLLCHTVFFTESWCFKHPAEVASAARKFPGVAASGDSTAIRVLPQWRAGTVDRSSSRPSSSSSLLSQSISRSSPAGGPSSSPLPHVAKGRWLRSP